MLLANINLGDTETACSLNGDRVEINIIYIVKYEHIVLKIRLLSRKKYFLSQKENISLMIYESVRHIFGSVNLTTLTRNCV